MTYTYFVRLPLTFNEQHLDFLHSQPNFKSIGATAFEIRHCVLISLPHHCAPSAPNSVADRAPPTLILPVIELVATRAQSRACTRSLLDTRPAMPRTLATRDAALESRKANVAVANGHARSCVRAVGLVERNISRSSSLIPGIFTSSHTPYP
ncbi:uncharacterized protein CC84DRAFT_1169561 [Paraphaeosphaeria sporulosa]|uniref:Uncharacterized protein n=1 Tax=Paraphaeosphaeria sporulosa TaxID=1460663 RepID=A0A177BWX5_9PLEO|nr:uncharacterized protein CC84DRAFT_1169561 [Paraphaeosphaeria sporulosa]OAF99460.1 hypothetical protein CC84DRAFT_1169561 [Paraphaeosphaeria sporulosa]